MNLGQKENFLLFSAILETFKILEGELGTKPNFGGKTFGLCTFHLSLSITKSGNESGRIEVGEMGIKQPESKEEGMKGSEKGSFEVVEEVVWKGKMDS